MSNWSSRNPNYCSAVSKIHLKIEWKYGFFAQKLFKLSLVLQAGEIMSKYFRRHGRAPWKRVWPLKSINWLDFEMVKSQLTLVGLQFWISYVPIKVLAWKASKLIQISLTQIFILMKCLLCSGSFCFPPSIT